MNRKKGLRAKGSFYVLVMKSRDANRKCAQRLHIKWKPV